MIIRNHFYYSNVLSNFEKFILVVFGIFVPTGDNYTDIVTSYKFFTGTYTPAGTQYYYYNHSTRSGEYAPIVPTEQPIYGLMTLLPVLISFTLTAIHWYNTEEKSQRLRTFPLLLAQIWPQYRTGRILWLYMKGDRKWIKEKEHVERQLSSLGEFVS